MGAGFSCEEPVFKRRSDVSAETRARQAGFDQAAWEAAVARVRRHRPLAHLRALRPALRRHADAGGAAGDPRAHEQVRRRGRARLRRLRLRLLPRPRGRHLAGARRGRDVPAVLGRGAAQDRRRAAAVQPLPGDDQGGAGQEREARQHGPARGRHRPRGQQPARHPPAARQPAARGLRGRHRRTAEDVKLIVDQANRCKKIISGLLNFARQSRVVRQPTDLTNLVAEVLRTHPRRRGRLGGGRRPPRGPRSPSSTATRSSRCSPTCSPTPSTRCPTAARITVTLDGTEENVIVTVRDEGTGIPDGEPRQAVQPVLHDQAGRQGHGPRPRRDPRHRQDAPRPDHRGVQRRPRHAARPAPRSASPCRGTRRRRTSRPACRRSPGAEA